VETSPLRTGGTLYRWPRSDGIYMVDGELAGTLIVWPDGRNWLKTAVAMAPTMSLLDHDHVPTPDDLLTQEYRIELIMCLDGRGDMWEVPVGMVGPRELHVDVVVTFMVAVALIRELWWGCTR